MYTNYNGFQGKTQDRIQNIIDFFLTSWYSHIKVKLYTNYKNVY